MKRLIASLVLGVVAVLGIGVTAATADPSVSLCHDVHITIAGTEVVNDAACNTAP